MKKNQKIVYYPNKNIQTESYTLGDASVTKHYYNAKDAYVREFITLENGVKEIKHFTEKGVLAKVENFVDDKRDGIETKYFISKADKSVKSTKTYSQGKLHGECLTYSDTAQIIKREVYADGKLISKDFS